MALGQGRAAFTRLDQIRGPEDAAADIVELWGAAESAMRAMLGGSVLSGQGLVRELRQQNVLNLDQANGLASFWDARSRVDDVNYKPTLTDAGYARAGFNHLSSIIESAGITGAFSAPAAAPPPVAAAVAPSIEVPMYESHKRTGLRGNSPLWIGVAVLVVLVVGVVAYLQFGRPSYDKGLAAAIDTMQRGQTEAARAAFVKVTNEYPDEAEPHVFLARFARNDGDLQMAHRELAAAIRNEPGNAQALREMGLLLLAENNAELARNFFVRAVQADTSDMASKGYLGCALIKLNRVEEGRKFLSRAGAGSWSSCATPVVRAPASVVR